MRPEHVLVVNAGSTSLKLHLVEGNESSPVETFVECDAVGHRVVHGGSRFVEPVVIDDEVKAAIRELTPLAPLHNAPALAVIEDAQQALPDVPHVAVFDTAFHRTMPDEAARYAIPEEWFDWGVRRYGFHGLSVEWGASQVPVPRLVVCHLGGGSSVTAVLEGRSVETTMGFSPLEGVPMTTRSGSVDPGALLYLVRERGLSADELDHAL
jgi:acetate kinase